MLPEPPETLDSPIQNPAYPSLPIERKTRYISFRDSGPTPTGTSGWIIPAANMLAATWTPPAWLHPPLTPDHYFVLASTGDDDDILGHVPPASTTPQPDLYFGCEAELIWTDGTTKWWSNLQSEYR